MAISDRINEMYTHVGDVYDTITNVDLPTNKNIQNIPSSMRSSYLEIMNNGIDKIWNNWEKVTGEGETITLNSTEEAPMKIDLKGNTSQETTTGKNLIPTQTDLWEQGSISGNDGKNIDSTIRLRTKEYYPISNDTDYYVSIQNSDYCFVNIILYNSNKIYIGQYYNISSDINGTRSKLINIPSASRPNTAYYRATVRKIDNTATITANEIEIAKPQIELGSTATDWEKYVGGVPSPNPDYPQDIHVVSGDNTIKVEGKNLLPTNASYWESGHYDTSGAKTWFDTRMRVKKLVPISPSTTYYVSNALNKRLIIREYNANKKFIYNTGAIDSGNTFTTQSNTYYLGISVEITYSEYDETTSQLFMCNNNVVDKTYEPYQSASYPISLGVKNLWDDNDFQNGYLPTTGSYPTTNPSYPNSRYILIRLNQGQSITIKKLINTNSFRIRYIDVATNQIVGTVVRGTNTYYTSTASYDSALNDGTITANRELLLALWDFTGTLSGALDVTYGTTLQYISNNPIELCKIGDYQDSIKKSTGKNLFDKDNEQWLSGYINGASATTLSASSYNRTLYIPCEPNTTYVIQKMASVTNSRFNIACTTETPIIGCNIYEVDIRGYFDTVATYTTTSNAKYLLVNYIQTNNTSTTVEEMLNSIMITKGNQVLPYEPYGKAWYLNKQIGKYTITGQESDRQYYWSSEINGIKFVLDDAIKTVANVPTYCNRFNQWYSGTTANNYVRLNRTTSYLGFWFGNITIEGVNSITTFKSYATNNQILLYYPLATPTYTEITDSTLLSQLEAVKKSYTTQTNINQDNNDLPFILDVTALKQFTQ